MLAVSEFTRKYLPQPQEGCAMHTPPELPLTQAVRIAVARRSVKGRPLYAIRFTLERTEAGQVQRPQSWQLFPAILRAQLLEQLPPLSRFVWDAVELRVPATDETLLPAILACIQRVFAERQIAWIGQPYSMWPWSYTLRFDSSKREQWICSGERIATGSLFTPLQMWAATAPLRALLLLAREGLNTGSIYGRSLYSEPYPIEQYGNQAGRVMVARSRYSPDLVLTLEGPLAQRYFVRSNGTCWLFRPNQPPRADAPNRHEQPRHQIHAEVLSVLRQILGSQAEPDPIEYPNFQELFDPMERALEFERRIKALKATTTSRSNP